MSKNKTVPIEALDGVPFMLVESDGNAEVADFPKEYNYSHEYLVQDVGRLCDYVDGQERAWS